MRVLVACEFSGTVREAFRARGHDAWSCDLRQSEIPGPHHQCDVRKVMDRGPWDMMIAHPPCQYLSNSGVLRLYRRGKKANGPDPERWRRMREAAELFRFLLNAPIPRICVENPIMHGYAKEIIGMAECQILQPWLFGVDASKATCLWLINMPPLMYGFHIIKRKYENQTTSGNSKLSPSFHRSADRSRTYRPIAEAMALQWGSEELPAKIPPRCFSLVRAGTFTSEKEASDGKGPLDAKSA